MALFIGNFPISVESKRLYGYLEAVPNDFRITEGRVNSVVNSGNGRRFKTTLVVSQRNTIYSLTYNDFNSTINCSGKEAAKFQFLMQDNSISS